MAHNCCIPVISEGVYLFDARAIAKRFRHAAIFGALNALQVGETMRFYNDHDPLPLLAQVNEYYGDQIEVAYVSREAGEVILDFRIKSKPAEARIF